ncbi:MAG: hypothetical protein ACREQ5_25650, partial [Candidatus Dormibacteria bacterium]
VEDKKCLVTAGDFPLLVTGAGGTIQEAQDSVYGVWDEIHFPVPKVGRTDIGDRLEKDLPKLQQFGYAKGLEF